MSKKALSHGLQGERIKSSHPVFLCVAKTGLFLVNRIAIRQILSLCDCDKHKRVRGTPRPAVRQRAITTYSKYRAAPDFAVIHKEDNDTPVQSQSERDKTVAGNEGGSGRPSVGVELPWCQFAADRLATSLRETHLHLGVLRTNRDASIIKPNTRRSIETENCLCSPDLKNFLVFG